MDRSETEQISLTEIIAESIRHEFQAEVENLGSFEFKIYPNKRLLPDCFQIFKIDLEEFSRGNSILSFLQSQVDTIPELFQSEKEVF